MDFLLYHINTIRKDPDRSYTYDADPKLLMKLLPKKLKDMKTSADSPLPYHNQASLARVISDLEYQELPVYFKSRLINKWNELIKINNSKEKSPEDEKRIES
jgi:hypothetical protein